jgi:hypothetical protein
VLRDQLARERARVKKLQAMLSRRGELEACPAQLLAERAAARVFDESSACAPVMQQRLRPVMHQLVSSPLHLCTLYMRFMVDTAAMRVYLYVGRERSHQGDVPGVLRMRPSYHEVTVVRVRSRREYETAVVSVLKAEGLGTGTWNWVDASGGLHAMRSYGVTLRTLQTLFYHDHGLCVDCGWKGHGRGAVVCPGALRLESVHRVVDIAIPGVSSGCSRHAAVVSLEIGPVSTERRGWGEATQARSPFPTRAAGHCSGVAAVVCVDIGPAFSSTSDSGGERHADPELARAGRGALVKARGAVRLHINPFPDQAAWRNLTRSTRADREALVRIFESADGERAMRGAVLRTVNGQDMVCLGPMARVLTGYAKPARWVTGSLLPFLKVRCTREQFATVCKESEGAEEHSRDDPWIAPQEVIFAALQY